MAKWAILGLILAILLVDRPGVIAYRSGGSGYRSGSEQAEQVGLSAAHSGHSAYGGEQQPIYQRESACPQNFQGLVAYPHDCHRFVNCNGGSATIQTCSPGTLFNPKTLQCDHPTNVDCSSAGGGAVAPAETTRLGRLRQLDSDPKCPNGVNGLHPHPTDCTKFLNCANGHAFIQDCGPGTAFNPSLLVCVHKGTVNCGGAGGSGSSGHAYSAVSSEQLGCPPGTRGLHPHPHDPHKYLRCGIGVQPQVEQCPQGQIFDGFRLVCVYSGSAQTSSSALTSAALQVNNLLCPAGAVGLFVHPFDQTKFINCKVNMVQSCQPGYVFSISRGYCHPKSQLVVSDYVTLIISLISLEYSFILTSCPGDIEGYHLYPYDAGRYVQCSAGGRMSILSCDPQKAFSLSQRACLPRRQVNQADRVKFWEEIQVHTTTTYYQDSQGRSQSQLSSLKSCPSNLRKNYAYPFHAGHYIKCQNGVLEIVCCPTGTLFSLSQHECVARHLLAAHDYLDYAYISVQFSTEFMDDLSTVTCPPQTEGYYLHPFDCTKYIKCFNQQTYIESCHQGEVFSIPQQRCLPKDEVKKPNDRVEYLIETTVTTTHHMTEPIPKEKSLDYAGDISCPPGVSGLHAHPFDCAKFLECANGLTYVKDCGPGTAFSTASGTCDFANKVDCSGRSSSAGLNQLSQGHPSPGYPTGPVQTYSPPQTAYNPSPTSEHLSDLLCPHGADGQFVHPFDQTKFLLCKAAKLAVQSCESGHVFSISWGTCQPKTQLVYTDYVSYVVSEISHELSMILSACPGGTDGLHLYPYDAGKYVRCSDGGKMSILSCGPQMAFSLSQRACRPSRQVINGDRVKFWEELTTTTTTYTYQDAQVHQSPLRGCPPTLQGNYPYPFHAGHFVKCQNGLLQVVCCPSGSLYSLSKRECVARHLLSAHDYLDHAYISVQFSTDFMQDLTTLTCPPQAQGYYLHPFDCTKYLICRDQQTSIGSCDQGEVFSISQQKCVVRDKVTDAFDRVEYLSETQHELSQEADEEQEQGRNGGYPSNGAIALTGRYQRPDQATEYQTPPYSYPSPSIGGVQSPAKPTGQYQPPPHSSAGYQPLSPVTGGYQQPQYSGGYQQNTQTSGGYQQPSQFTGGYQPSAQPSGGYQQPSQFSGGYQQAHQSSGGYQQPSQSTGGYPPYSQNNGGYQWSSQAQGGSHGASVPNGGYQTTNKFTGGYQSAGGPYSQGGASYYPGGVQPSAPPAPLMCPQRVNGLFPNPFDAMGYLTCIEGHTLVRQCLPLDVFSISRGYCLPEHLVVATDRIPFVKQQSEQEDLLGCPRGAIGFYVYPFDCSQYLSCGPNGMTLLSCPEEQHFSVSHGICKPQGQVQREDRLYTLNELHIIYDWTQKMMAEGAVPACPEGITGSLPHPRVSSKYLRCEPGHAAIYDCPSQQIFSVSRRLCVLDEKLPSHDRSDYLVRVEGTSGGWIAPSNDNRQSKSYETSGRDQWGNRYTTKTTTTTRVISEGDRWRDMNMQRPAGIGLEQNPHHQQGSWSGQESSYVQREPSQNVLYVEGSLQPNHARETARTEQTLDPSSTYSSTNFHRSTRRAMIDTTPTTTTTATNNWHAPGHSRDYHRRHPNLPDPFSKHYPNHNPYPSPHHHQKHHPHHEHSADFHRRHPELPNPFPKAVEPDHQPEEEQEEDWEPNPNAEEVTPKVGVRSSFTEDCEFDCGNGKCLKKEQVCNGQKNCDNGKDELNCPPRDYEVRLTGGEKPHMGRIEVKANGQWGYVCDDKFGLKDADVVCRELGFPMGAQEVRGSSFYAPPNQDFNYVMDEVECRGNETKLSECPFKGWGVHNCGVDEVAGVICKVPVMKCPNNYWLCHTSKECIPPAFVCDNTEDCADKSDECAAVCQAPVQYRLEGGRSPTEGRLEVKYHGVWGSVCDDDFNQKSAQVACNSMGFYGPATIEKNIFGNGNGPIWLDQVMCFGNETGIDKCSHWNWGENNCNHTEDVALHCTAGPPPRSQKLSQNPIKGGRQESAAKSYNQIGLWERSSKALRTPRRCGIFKDDLTDEYAHHEERVVRGNVAQRGRHPWQATIRTRGRGHISSHWCGAVVISKRHLLTAAHCVYGTQKGAYFVRVGDHYANIAESSEVDTFIETWYIHEEFRKGTHMNNDIALVVLKTPLKFSDYVQPICLPEKNGELVENRNCTISGWGSIKAGVSTPAQVLGSAELPILPDHVCKQSNVYGSAMSEGMFCAGFMDESVDACEGDSGGPLVCPDDDGETLYGLISWGQHCGYKNRPGVYVRVNHYIDWIYEKINESMQRF
ncbi:uncharacterized protein teq isoform X2 [Drosophila kikkawai]|uniref:Uncharacterized protein teq isoform X2 n=1 Tax=Drosophila kikkawai TaxID=30033 RepID=A0A6P4IYH6_DROKI|nr:uncharacterized protein LOC108078766 isoform X2 [Drosophila kikkawai]